MRRAALAASAGGGEAPVRLIISSREPAVLQRGAEALANCCCRDNAAITQRAADAGAV
jgi:hypothetical protein